MNTKRLGVLIAAVGLCLIGSACSKTNLAVPAAPATVLVSKQSKDTRPLYFVNNVEVSDFKQAKVGPNDIERVDVVKPSATNDLVSTYGLRAKNGIIFVTTKHAK